MAALTMDKLVALCKGRGFIFAGSEIYGGLANSWDYGPLGVEFKNNVKKAWWQKFVQESKYNVGLDAAILMNREVWVASGHVGGFNDPLMDCKACKARFRADKLIEDFTKGEETGDGWTNEELEKYIAEHDIVCPVCGKRSSGAQLALVENSSVAVMTDRLPAGEAVVRMGEGADDTLLLSVAFETAGRLSQANGQMKVTLPAESFQNYGFALLNAEGAETPLPVQEKNGQISFLLDFTEPVCLLRLTEKAA